MKNRHKYPENWFDEIRPAILARDKFKCVNCGIKQRSRVVVESNGELTPADEWLEIWADNAGLKVRTIWLQVAHLDQDTQNNDHSNLRTLCPRCHLKHDNSHNKLKRLQSLKSRKV